MIMCLYKKTDIIIFLFKKVTLYPTIRVVLVAPEGKELLHKHSIYLFTDGTFDTCEERLLLTTAIVLIEELTPTVIVAPATSEDEQTASSALVLSSSPSTSTSSSADGSISPLLSNTRCNCGRGKANQTCVRKQCLACCSASPDHCIVSSHLKAKALVAPHPAVAAISTAMADGSTLWIRYDGGSQQNSVRPVQPHSWLNQGFSFRAMCLNSGLEKTYKISCTVEWRNSSF